MPKKGRLQPLQIYQILPRTNCKKCGCLTCFAFAFSLISREKRPEDCPDLQTEDFRSSLETLKGAFGGEGVVKEQGLFIEKEKCNGCGDCVVVCQKALSNIIIPGTGTVNREEVPPVLWLVDGVVDVVNWSSCKRAMNPPELCRVCEEKCTFGALELVR